MGDGCLHSSDFKGNRLQAYDVIPVGMHWYYLLFSLQQIIDRAGITRASQVSQTVLTISPFILKDFIAKAACH